jgi:hypothetical protein
VTQATRARRTQDQRQELRTETPSSDSASTREASAEAPLRLRITGAFFRHRGSRVTFDQTRPSPPAEPTRQPAQVARMLALAHHLQRAMEGGAVANQAALAKAYGLTRARLTQVLDLLLLAPDLQEQVLAMDAVDGRQPLAERRLRRLAICESWAEQRANWPATKDR